MLVEGDEQLDAHALHELAVLLINGSVLLLDYVDMHCPDIFGIETQRSREVMGQQQMPVPDRCQFLDESMLPDPDGNDQHWNRSHDEKSFKKKGVERGGATGSWRPL